MSELTSEQRSVVEHQSGALLVSASAGSGKTRVLVERVMEKLCDREHPADIDSFLIVTFKTEAAAELRVKLSEKISERLGREPGNRHLRQQLSRLSFAQISTVHSFCAEVLRNYAHLADVPADFRIAESVQSDILRQRAADDAVEFAYAGYEEDTELRALLDTLGKQRNDRALTGLVISAYQSIQAHPRPMQWLEQCRQELEKIDGGVENTIWGKYLLESFRAFCDAALSQMAHCTEVIDQTPEIEKYRANIEELTARLTEFRAMEWDELTKHSKPSFAKLATIRNCQDEAAKNHVSELRKACMKALSSRLSLFGNDADTVTEALKSTRLPLRGFFRVLEKLDERFRAEKRQRRLLDFSDLEHETVRLLLDSRDQPTAVAKELSEQFTEIMVDEYQDASTVQDCIYHAISRDGSNLFFVGDVKQSIYSFRLADPTIFLDKYQKYALRENVGSEPRKILLTKNFRSSAEILSAVNDVFSAVMSPSVGGMAYTEAEQMVCGGDYPPLGEEAVELHFLDTRSPLDDAETDKNTVEARFVAGRIAELIREKHLIHDGSTLRPIRPGDIAILLRSYKSVSTAYLEALAAEGIPVSGRSDADILTTTHVQTLLAFLRVIENPHSDFRMAAALTGPVGGFTAEDMARLRLAGGGACLYDALLARRDEASCGAFLRLLEDLRAKSRWMTLEELLDETMDALRISEVFGSAKNGVRRCAELRAFRAFCGDTIRRGISELGSLLRYIDDLRENGETVSAEAETGSDCVRVMTVHSSKGLEFPVVFLCDLMHRFNNQYTKEHLQTDASLMAGCRVIDRTRMISYRSAALEAIKQKKAQDQSSEELRLLYVAMTRAKSRLIMTLCADKIQTSMNNLTSLATFPMQPLCAAKASSFGDWLIMAAAVRPEARHLFGGSWQTVPAGSPRWRIELHANDAPAAAQPQMTGTAPAEAMDTGCLGLQYTFADIPAKLTATQLKGRRLDEESADGAAAVSNRPPKMSVREYRPDGRTLTAAERGTATHRFLQFCAYEACESVSGVEAEKQRLVQAAFLRPEEADSVPAESIVRFFTSPLGKQVLTAQQRSREYKFSLLVEAGRFLPGGGTEPVMLQGVVDCFWIAADGIHILDFKTDAVTEDSVLQRGESYRPQMEAYAAALAEIYGLPVAERILYFFASDTPIRW